MFQGLTIRRVKIIDSIFLFLRTLASSALDGLQLALTLTGRPRAGRGPWCLLATALVTFIVLGIADYSVTTGPRQLSLLSLALDATWILVLLGSVYVTVHVGLPVVARPLESALTRIAAAIWVPLLVATVAADNDFQKSDWFIPSFVLWVTVILARAAQPRRRPRAGAGRGGPELRRVGARASTGS